MEVIINGTIAELGNSTPAITKKSIDIENPSIRFIDFTNSFQLPDTNINREIFKSPKGIGTNNQSFEELYNIEIQDIFQIFRGKGYLSAASKNEFNLQIIDDSRELFKALDIKLNQLSFDDKDTILTQAAIDALDSVDETNPFYWGKACYHTTAIQANTDQTTGDARTKYSRPALYVSALLRKAVINAGYSLELPDIDLALSTNSKEFFFTSYQKDISGTYNPAGTLALSGLDTNDFEHADLTVTSTTINIGTKNTIFRVRGNCTTTANIFLVVTATDNVDPTKITESKILLPQSGAIDFSTAEFKTDNGSTIAISFEGTGQVAFTDTLLYTILNDKNEDLSTNPFLDYKIKAHDNLPDLTYLDLFRLICVVSNKFQIVDNFNKVLSFGTLANLNKLNSVDWSEKFIIDSENIVNDFKNLGQKNKLKYDNDQTVNIDNGNSFFNVNSKKLQEEFDYIMLNFSSSNDVTINSNTIAHLPVYTDTTRITEIEIKQRLWAINSDKLQFNSLDWSQLKSTYYANWFQSLERIRVIDCQMNLKKLDVLKWHEKQLVYIDYFKSTFIVLEINNFIPGRPTSVKLLNYGR